MHPKFELTISMGGTFTPYGIGQARLKQVRLLRDAKDRQECVLEGKSFAQGRS